MFPPLVTLGTFPHRLSGGWKAFLPFGAEREQKEKEPSQRLGKVLQGRRPVLKRDAAWLEV